MIIYWWLKGNDKYILLMRFYFLLLFLFSPFSLHFDINRSAPSDIINMEAQLLVNRSSSLIPPSSFIFYLLYGTTNVDFTLNQILTSFRSNTTDLKPVYIIIWNDGKLAGVCTDNQTFITPVLGKLIEIFPTSQLNQYFTQGYTIKKTDYPESKVDFSLRQVSINGDVNMCEAPKVECTGGIYFEDDVDYLSPHSFWRINIKFDTQTSIFFTGFLDTFDGKGGNINLISNYLVQAENTIIQVNLYKGLAPPNKIVLQNSLFLNMTSDSDVEYTGTNMNIAWLGII